MGDERERGRHGKKRKERGRKGKKRKEMKREEETSHTYGTYS
jgi:hypothetical protein